MWNWYQKQLQDPQTPLLTDRQMDALQRKLLADFNASTPANRPSAGPANPTVRNLLLLQGYVSDGVLKMLNSTLGSTRDKAGFAKSALKAPVIAMLALASIVLGLMQGSAVGAWEKWVRGRMTSLPTPMDKDFWTQISKFAEGTAGLAASNWMYLGDLILWINGEIHGNRGFDPYMRIFGLSVLQRAINAIRGVRETALGTQGLSTKSLIPLLDAVKSTAGWYYEVEHAMGGGAGKLKQGERVERGEYASQGMLQGRSGFTPPAYGPTTISRRLIGDYISQWNDLKEKDPAGAQRALDNAKEEIQKLEDYHYRKYLAAGKPEDEARKLAQRDTWNDYQEINPAVAALLGRRPTQAQHDLMLAGLSGDRLAAAQTAESYWKAGAMALFNREGYITKEEAAASRQGAGKGFALPGLPRLPQMPRMPNPFRRVRVPGVNRGPARNVRRAVQRMVSSPLNKVRRGRAAVRRFVNRQRTPSLAGRKRSVVRRQPFAPYSLA